MTTAKRIWVGIAAWAAAAITMAVTATALVAAPLAVSEGASRPEAPNAAALLRFYPTPLSSTPSGFIEDRDAWLAKVQGLLSSAPSLLQQSLLASQSKQEFSANIALLDQVQSALVKQANLDFVHDAKVGRVGTKSIGDSSNLVYKALPPCRLMDTRNASFASGVQGPLTGNTLYSLPGYITNGSNWGQYGGAGTSDCDLDSVYGGTIYAVALVITILNPNFDAYLGVSQTNNLATTLSTVALNYTHGQGLSTLYIVPQISSNTIYFAMPAGLSADVIFDVVGFFHRSDATALECTIAVSAETAIPANVWTAVDATCPAGYSATGGGNFTNEGTLGYPGVWTLSVPASSSAWRVWVDNQTGGSRNVQAQAQCCRIPGR